ncbi:MAG TPA: hypothetical protein VNW97_02125 [Candidatus Saccharimonadales bacterium]|jgi:hypothetical protein|nr:hypothetical protein [Candidatus Saccharimonadales bacterium]
MEMLPKRIVYAKNDAHQKFLDTFNGQLKGRTNLSFLVVIEFVGGEQLRKKIEAMLGNPTYLPDEWCSARDAIVMFDQALRAGVAAERLGHRVMPTYKNNFPAIFEGKTIRDAFEILERAYASNTTYGGVSPVAVVEPKRALVYRKGSPLPCDYFVGVINGLLKLFSIDSTTREIACQWNGAPACCYETTWAN